MGARDTRRGIARSGQGGSALLEVLLSVTLLSMGVLAFTGLMAVSVQATKESEHRSAATNVATSLADRVRANPQGALAGDYDYAVAYNAGGAIPIPACAVATNCTTAEIGAIDLAQVRRDARFTLPGGSLFAQVDAAAAVPSLDLWVIWREARMKDEGDVGKDCPAAAAAGAVILRCMHFRVAL